MVLIGSSYIENFIALLARVEIGIGVKEPRTLPHCLRSAVQQYAIVTSEHIILPYSVCDVGAYMNLFVTEIGTHWPTCKHIINVE
ncbi:hypothetical protein D3C76_1221380 [compost metagenome]